MSFKKQATASLPTFHGEFTLQTYQTNDSKEHAVLLKGKPRNNCLVRIHSECLTGDVFHSLRCDCHAQLKKAMSIINQTGGLIIYLRQEGRGIGLVNKTKAYKLQEDGLDTLDANLKLGFRGDERNYAIAAEILQDLNIDTIQLLSNNPSKKIDLEKYGITVSIVPLTTLPNEHNYKYIQTKKARMGHLFEEIIQ
jgi:3,4-dihydroxy 2-butanone 4-phosphate synthase / GTP cyclohydrolase II